MSELSEFCAPRQGSRDFDPARPLWQLVPTRGDDGMALTDLVMLIPGLNHRTAGDREELALAIHQVCESYVDKVVFAEVNYALNLLWVSTRPEPGLTARVAASIRERVPQALLVAGQLSGPAELVTQRPSPPGFWRRLRRLGRRVLTLQQLSGPTR